ncbi:MAG: hypothetical protein ABR581_01665 [Thermoleophilaceae bacterium]
MDFRRLRAGELIAAAGGLALFVSLFLPWYRLTPSPSKGLDRTAWEALAVNDVILALVALAALSLLLVTAVQETSAVPIAMASLVTIAGLVGLLLVLVRVAWLPDLADQRAWGLWLGLAGALAIVGGGLIAMRDERLSPAGRSTDASGRPVPPPPEVEAQPLSSPGSFD